MALSIDLFVLWFLGASIAPCGQRMTGKELYSRMAGPRQLTVRR